MSREDDLHAALTKLVRAVRTSIPAARHGIEVSVAINGAERLLKLQTTTVNADGDTTLEDAAKGAGGGRTR